MLDWQWCQVCYPLEIKLLLTDLGGGVNKAWKETDETEKNSPPIKTCLKDNIAPFPGIKVVAGENFWLVRKILCRTLLNSCCKMNKKWEK